MNVCYPGIVFNKQLLDKAGKIALSAGVAAAAAATVVISDQNNDSNNLQVELDTNHLDMGQFELN